MALIFLFLSIFFLLLYDMLTLKICVGVFSGIFKAQGHGSYFYIFHPFFFLSPNYKLTLKVCVRVVSGIFKARMLKLCIHMDNEYLYCSIENRTPCSYSSLYLSIFLSFMAKFVSQFSQELYKLESSNMVYICRIRDCIVGLRHRVMALIFLFLSIFLYYMLTLKICVGVYSGIFS